MKKKSRLKRDEHLIHKMLKEDLITAIDKHQAGTSGEEPSEVENYKEKYVRLLAEFENYRRRTSREKEDLIKYSLEDFIKELIPTIDNLDRTISSILPNTKKDPILDGIKLVRDNFDRILKNNDVESFSSIGNPFDPDLHDALMSQDSDEHDSQTVIQEFERGYKYHDRIIRHAKVIVAK
ncbi:MAG: nucleotide exchange factor GrpE [Candidatus Marinimicrobia bacterium]|nr:nucleotide exchange factor GrpE [Candidatus Neomarinimicrobiota bacterium]